MKPLSRPVGLADKLIVVALMSAVLLVAAIVSMIAIAITGASPTRALDAMVTGALGTPSNVYSVLTKMLPTLLAALAWIIAITAGRLNIGMEGQILVGGVCAAAVGLFIGPLPGFIHLPLGVLAGIVGGGLYAGIAAWLWARRHIHELLSTLLLNFVAIFLVRWLARAAWSEQPGFLDYSRRIGESARWPVVTLLDGRISVVILVVLPLSVALVWFVLRRTTHGSRLRIVGSNETFARYLGYSPTRAGVQALLASGALAGLAGSCLIQGGESARLLAGFSADHGFEGIVAALLARNGPIAVVLSSLLFAILRQGSVVMEVRAGVSAALALTVVATIVLLVTLTEHVLRRRESRRIEDDAVSQDVATPAKDEEDIDRILRRT